MKSCNIKLMHAGFCKHIEALAVPNGRFKITTFPALFALIEHPSKGYFLFDTGLNPSLYEKNSKFPDNLYTKIIPTYIEKEQTAKQQLINLGINPIDIKGIFVSHFHADHIAGILDFPTAKIYCHLDSFNQLNQKSKFKQMLNGYFKNLIPANFNDRVIPVEQCPTTLLPEELKPFTHAYDVLQDQSLLVIPLPGHANGQCGLMVQGQRSNLLFLIADACWNAKAFMQRVKPNFVSKIIASNAKEYDQTLNCIHQLFLDNKHIDIIPSHCLDTYHKMRAIYV